MFMLDIDSEADIEVKNVFKNVSHESNKISNDFLTTF